MASFYDTTIGQQIEFQRVLASAGFTDTDIARIIKDPNLASKMHEAIQLKQLDFVALVTRQLEAYVAKGFSPLSAPRRQILADAAAAFVPLSPNDRPLVTGFFGYEPEGINRAWKYVELEGYRSVRYFDEKQPVRYASGMRSPNNHVRLVHFDPNSYQGNSPKSALEKARKDGVRLAGIEVVEMLIVEPEYALEWDGEGHPYPNCSALQRGTDWSVVPYLNRWDGHRQLVLIDYGADYRNDYWSSPSVREC